MAKKKAAPRNGHTGPRMFIDRELDAEPNDEPNTTSDTEASESLIRHPEFFFDNTLVAIQVEKTLFNVHKYQLSKSKVFSDRFKRSKADDGEPKEGSSPEHPIKLGDISASDFTSLMRVLYASYFSSNQPALEANLIIPAFRLAHIFDFSDLYAFLLPLAEENLDDADKIVFARELEITKWLVPSHVRLCKREKPLTTQEAKKIGVESVLLISRMREQHRCQSPRLSLTIGKYYCDNCAGVTYEPVGGYKCWGCATHTNVGLLCNGTGHTRVPVVDDDAIEAGVKKWVKDGFPPLHTPLGLIAHPSSIGGTPVRHTDFPIPIFPSLVVSLQNPSEVVGPKCSRSVNEVTISVLFKLLEHFGLTNSGGFRRVASYLPAALARSQTFTSHVSPSAILLMSNNIITPVDGSSGSAADSKAPIPKSKPAVKRHSEFFFDNTLVAIQVEDTLFNVHKYQLLKSETFSDMFKAPKAEDGEPEEGSSPECPIIMDGVNTSDFVALLKVLYARNPIIFPSHFSTHQPEPEASLIIPAFRLANMWNFADLRTFLLPLAEKHLSDIDKILFAREFDIKDWLAPVHIRLCERQEKLTTEEARKLGVDSILLVARLGAQGSTKPVLNPGAVRDVHVLATCIMMALEASW
ncbi:hypothetical protein RHS03_07885, partial [Rhizoctonia solani]